LKIRVENIKTKLDKLLRVTDKPAYKDLLLEHSGAILKIPVENKD
jgi:hypothetical protein